MVFSNTKKIMVLGLGKSGYAAALLAQKKGFEVIVIDESDTVLLREKKLELERVNIEVYLDYREEKLPKADLIVISPGISENSSIGKKAVSSHIKIISEVEFASYFTTIPIIAVTGTNGKTTVTELCTYMLNNLGLNAVFAGNIGVPFSEIIKDDVKCDYIVLEISSFQLHFCGEFKPYIALILNIESDHINWHGTFNSYFEDKLKIGAKSDSKNTLIINHKLLTLATNFLNKISSKLLTVSVTNENSSYYLNGEAIFFMGEKIGTINDLRYMGKSLHNIENALFCIAVCRVLKLKFNEIILSMKGFSTGEHRLELIGEKNNIKFINDSKSTNPLAMIAALQAVGKYKNVCLIAGGLDKNMDFSPVIECTKYIKKIFLIGKSKNKLEKLFYNVLNYCLCDSFEQSVNAACDFAESGDIVLLSPGCASMDMFKDYIERGNYFKILIKRRYFDEKSGQKD